mmetsp:Transcript_4481/g.12620  ORF Transcript_4481/g.12620 Transcript_4481/m.12620 type:complete len:211 (+) Transcript_4481:683-1315(+)
MEPPPLRPRRWRQEPDLPCSPAPLFRPRKRWLPSKTKTNLKQSVSPLSRSEKRSAAPPRLCLSMRRQCCSPPHAVWWPGATTRSSERPPSCSKPLRANVGSGSRSTHLLLASKLWLAASTPGVKSRLRSHRSFSFKLWLAGRSFATEREHATWPLLPSRPLFEAESIGTASRSLNGITPTKGRPPNHPTPASHMCPLPPPPLCQSRKTRM